jgi:hypothetical protein
MYAHVVVYMLGPREASYLISSHHLIALHSLHPSQMDRLAQATISTPDLSSIFSSLRIFSEAEDDKPYEFSSMI